MDAEKQAEDLKRIILENKKRIGASRLLAIEIDEKAAQRRENADKKSEGSSR